MNLNGGVVLNRIAPQGPPQAYRTYGALSPLRSHFRAGLCEEADCEAYRTGWVTTVDLATELGQKQAHYITHDKTRRHTVQRVTETLVKFMFGPGQRCFTRHMVRTDRPARFVVRGGDWRGNPSGYQREHTRAEFWVEEQQEQFDRVRTIVERG